MGGGVYETPKDDGNDREMALHLLKTLLGSRGSRLSKK